jgi:hypothetical protein
MHEADFGRENADAPTGALNNVREALANNFHSAPAAAR